MGLEFKNARTVYRQAGSWSHIETRVREDAAKRGKLRTVTDEVDDTVSAYVEVNWERWIIPCPFCTSSMYADPDDHRFLCAECFNAENGGRWVPVVWPDDPPAIEAVLRPRPEEHTRSWKPGESVAKLKRENDQLFAAGVRGMRR